MPCNLSGDGPITKSGAKGTLAGPRAPEARTATEIDPAERDPHLNGWGLLLVPSYFYRQRPITLADDQLLPEFRLPGRRGPLSAGRFTGVAGPHAGPHPRRAWAGSPALLVFVKALVVQAGLWTR
ncbi:hypothetical protein ABT097_32490 [Streptomyces sp. NPDC002225]|uniref:hypothetical protein n=1 Tax=Streptomyces sp. NPDC002225 TaxID=3154413 RepID=UPI0033236077